LPIRRSTTAYQGDRRLTCLTAIDERRSYPGAPEGHQKESFMKYLHAVELFRLLGGGVPGDLAGLPRSRLAVLPGTTHVTLVDRADWLTPMITEFLDAPTPEAK
jgi:hypothetical protein